MRLRVRVRVRVRTVGGLPTGEGARLLEANSLLCGFALSVAHDRLSLRAQALAQLTAIFPSVPPSAIAAALGKAGGSVEQAADLLFKAAQARPACTMGTERASPPTAGRQCGVGTHMNTHGRTREDELTQAVVPSVAGCGGLHV